MGLKGVVDNIARQGSKIRKLLDAPTEGQKKIEKPVKAQRAYAKGQAKAALTVGGLSGLSIAALRKMLKDEKEEKNRAILQTAIEKAVAKAMSNTADKKYKGGAMGYNSGGMLSRKGNYDMRKGGMFMKGTK